MNDNLPDQFVWVSPRLTREITATRSAKRPRSTFTATPSISVPLSVDPSTPSFSVELGMRTQEQRDQVLADAVAATALVADRTGTIQHPGTYVRTVMDFHFSKFLVQGEWEDDMSYQPVAGLFAAQMVDGVGRVLMALFGSAHNWRADVLPERYYGRTASDTFGLYSILDAVHEPGDHKPYPRTLQQEQQRDAAVRIQAAVDFLGGVHRPTPSAPFEVLAQVFDQTENITVEGVPFDKVFLGTPVWAGVPAPQQDALYLRVNGRERELRLTWEEDLLEDAEYWNASLELPGCPKVAPSDWPMFARWLAELGQRLGRPTWQLLTSLPPRRLDPRRLFGTAPQPLLDFRTGIEGYVVEIPAGHVLVDDAGRAIPVMVHHPGLPYQPDHNVYGRGVEYDSDDSQLGRHEDPIDLAQQHLDQVIEALWLLAVEWRAYPFSMHYSGNYALQRMTIARHHQLEQRRQESS